MTAEKHYERAKEYGSMKASEEKMAATLYAEQKVSERAARRERISIQPKELVDRFLRPMFERAAAEEMAYYKGKVLLYGLPYHETETDVRTQDRLDVKVFTLQKCLFYLEQIAAEMSEEAPT